MTRSFIVSALALFGFTLVAPVAAQSPCSQAYRIVYKTVSVSYTHLTLPTSDLV